MSFELENGLKLRSLRGMILYSKVMRDGKGVKTSSVNIVIELLLFFSAAKKLWFFFLFVCFILYTKITLHSCDVTSVCCYFINNCIIIILLLTEYFENTEVEGKRRTWNEYLTGNALCTVCFYKGMFLYLLVFFSSSSFSVTFCKYGISIPQVYWT